MTNTNGSITIAPLRNPAEFSNSDLQAMTARIKVMIKGGRKLQDQEAQALAAFSVATGLNPFIGEAVYIPGSGPEIGKQGYRRKAQEQLEYEAERAGYRNPVVLNEQVRDALPGQADFQDGDIAVIVSLSDSLTTSEWLGQVNQTASQMTGAGFKGDAWKVAQEIVGPKPAWEGIGVVNKDENFGKGKYDRRERAIKRGMKQAIQKRFPRLYLPEMSADELQEYTISAPEPPREKKTENQLLHELGFGDVPVEHENVIEHAPENPLAYADVNLFEDVLENPKAFENRQEFWLKQYHNGLEDGLTDEDAAQFANKGLASEVERRASA